MIWFTSDLHLGHARLLEWRSHYPTIEAMDTAIINGINDHVKRDDELWILGDFIWKPAKYGHYRQRLNVRKLHIVMGNHDTRSLRVHVSTLNDMVCRKFNGIRFHMTHYPLASWSGKEHGSVHLYGHCHSRLEDKLDIFDPGRNSMDIGADNAYKMFGYYAPFAITDILNLFGIPYVDIWNR